MLKITTEMAAEYNVLGVPFPNKAHSTDSGFDIFAPCRISLNPGERNTIPLGVKFNIKLPFWALPLRLLGFGIEAQIRPKSGLSKQGIDIEIGTVDEPYRGFVGATVTNTTKKIFVFEAHQKICQIVFVPVFNRVKLVKGRVKTNTVRGAKGFGSSGR